MKFYGGSTAYYGVADAAGWFQGGALSSLVPYTWDVAIGGIEFNIDDSQPFYRQYHRQLAPLIRTQADTSAVAGEHSLDPNSLWRRSFEDWSDGAGQRYLDRSNSSGQSTSSDSSFWQSKGIDPLTNKWQITLLPDTTSQYTSSNTNLVCIQVNGYIYISDGQSLKFTNSLAGTVSWTTVTGTPAVTLSSICTDGNTVYCAYGASGIYTTTAGAGAATNYVSAAIGSTAVLGFVNQRLMLGNNGSGGDGKLYNIVAGGASLPTALLVPNAAATWVGFAEGDSFLYAGATVGNKGIVYGCQVASDGMTLNAPSVQGQLPLGETMLSIYGYEGDLFLGTSLGIRFATASSSGVSLGSVISGVTPSKGGGLYGPANGVRCIGGYADWIWFGWSNYDGVSTGLGRMDLRSFVTAGLPSFASDLMATAQGSVVSVANLNGTTIFAVSGAGFYVQSANLVASGTILSGYILYDLTDKKIANLLDVQTVGPLAFGSYSAALSVDNGPFDTVGSHSVGEPEPVTFGFTGFTGQRFEVQLTLNRDGVTTTSGPAITRWTLRAYPAPQRPLNWQLPLLLFEKETNLSGTGSGFDPFNKLQALEMMALAGEPVSYQEANQSYQVYVTDITFLPDYHTRDKHYWNGIALVTLQQLLVPEL